MSPLSSIGRPWAKVASLAVTIVHLFAPVPVAAQTSTIEYIAHAAVVIEAGPTRILIDPYNGSRWMGYGFPRDLDVDAVLVTHPHYDHDASYYAGSGVPVFTEPGRYQVGGVELIGVESEHAGGDRFRQRGATPWNVIWTVVADGVRFTHVGDNRVLTAADLAAVSRTDVLFVPPFHANEVAWEEARQLRAGVLIPIHYRLPEMAAEDFGMSTVDDWLGELTATRHDTNRMALEAGAGGDDPTIHVLSPHPAVTRWRLDLTTAWALARDALAATAAGDAEMAVSRLRQAVALAPEVMMFPLDLGTHLIALERTDQAIRVWESALARSGEGDVEPTLRIRAGLATAYMEQGRGQEADILWRQIRESGRSYAADLLPAVR